MQARTLVGAAIFCLCVTGAAQAQDACTGTGAALRIPDTGAPAAMDLPSGHRTVEFGVQDPAGIDQLDPAVKVDIPAAESQWTMSAAQADLLRKQHTEVPAKQLVLIWSGAPGQKACTTRLDVPGSPPPPPPPAPNTEEEKFSPKADVSALATRIRWDAGDCGEAGKRWVRDIDRDRSAHHEAGTGRFTALIFAEDQGVCYTSRDYGVAGDPIYVAIFTDQPQNWNGLSASFDPCAAEPAAPNVYAPGTLPAVPSGRQTAEYRLRAYLPRRCFNTAVDITVRSTGGEPQVAARYNLAQAERYRAGLQLGTAFTDLSDHSFGLRPSGDASVVYDKGPTDTGPEYFASVVIYSVLRYVPALLGGDRYLGRDIIHDQSPLDRLGLVLGTGLRHPADRFLIGGSLELLPGVNVVAAHQTAKVRRLAGVEEGEVFKAAEDKIPTRDQWEQGWSWGLSLDLRYAASLLNRP